MCQELEAGEIWISDIEHLLLAKVFCVRMEDLLPQMDGARSLFIVSTTANGWKTQNARVARRNSRQ